MLGRLDGGKVSLGEVLSVIYQMLVDEKVSNLEIL